MFQQTNNINIAGPESITMTINAVSPVIAKRHPRALLESEEVKNKETTIFIQVKLVYLCLCRCLCVCVCVCGKCVQVCKCNRILFVLK